MTFQNRFQILVDEKKKTFRQLAEECEISKTSFAAWYRGESMPNSYALIKLCKYFDVSADWLLGLSNFRRLKK